MPPSYFPLRWESTGDQWWYASPIDFAAANGHYDLVRELLHIDTNLLIKLTSLRRIRRLESVWDDEEKFNDVAKCRSLVAKKLLLECETKKGHNSLIRAGYGGWLLYTAASAGDVNFVKELLERDPLLVFGEGEYGVTDILYAAARSKNSEVFRTLLNTSVSLRKDLASGEELEGKVNDSLSEFKREMMNRTVLSAARGGNLEILKELLGDCSNVLAYSDAQGYTILHAASGRGQVEVVKDIIASYDIINATDYQGNTALHVAAYRGHLPVVEILISASPTLTSQTNNYGDTFLHTAVSGFRTPGFRRVDRQVELIKKIVDGSVMNIQEIINVRNNDGRTALHLAVIDNIQSNLVELLMAVPPISLNIRDVDGMTALDLLKQRPRTASSEILIKQLISAGGISDCQDNVVRNAIALHLRWHGMQSPGTSFKVSDAEIFLYTGIENASDVSCELSSIGYSSRLSDLSEPDANSVDNKKPNSVNTAATRLKSLLHWTKKKQKKSNASEFGDDDSLESFRLNSNPRDYPIPLRQRYSNMVSFSSNLRADSFSTSLPSPMTRKKFTAGLTQGVLQAQHFPHSVGSPSSQFSGSSMNSPRASDNERDNTINGLSNSNRSLKDKKGSPSLSKKKMNKYFCFGAQGLAVEESIRYSHIQPMPIRGFKRATSLVA